ncbi:MFS transporter [Kibdelosporangium aridum]|uniref:MFS transporter n=1 Tax=Kibdelosporangium aridum TaxID=2030 RepID=UPI0006895DD4
MPRTKHVYFGVTLCALVVIAEGYDLIVFGAVLPSLLNEPGWGLTSATAGAVGSQAYIGMLIGALVGGRLSDVFGRRRFVLSSVGWFALWTSACAAAGQPWQLGMFRLLAGVGMGAVLPAVLALAREIAPPQRTALTFTILMAGVPAGGMSASLLGLVVLPTFGWRAMFAFGGAVTMVVFLLAVVKLPESHEFREKPANRTKVTELFGRRFLATSLLFPVANFMMLLTWFGMNTWLTTLMRQLNYPLASALQFSMTLNLGALAGGFLLAAIGQRWGSRPAAAIGALIAGSAILACVMRPSTTAIFLLFVAVIGIGAQSALTLIAASVADHYPALLRGTAIGWTQATGRVGAIAAPTLGGWILAAQLGPRAVLVAFMIASLLGAVFLTVLMAMAAGRRMPRRALRERRLDDRR